MFVYGDQTVSVPEHLSFSKFMLDRFRAVRGREICLVSRLCSSNIEVTQHTYDTT